MTNEPTPSNTKAAADDLRPPVASHDAEVHADEEMPEALRTEDKAFSIQILQFFLFPVLIVAAALAVIIMFGVSSGGKANVDDLLADLRFGSRNKRQQAAYHLAKRFNEQPELAQSPDVAAALLDILETRTELTEEMRKYVMLAGGITGDHRFTPHVLEELKGFYSLGEADQVEFAEREAVLYMALEKLRDPASVEVLLGYYARPNETTRKLVIQALDPIDTEEVRTFLVETALKDEYSDVQWNAALKLAARKHPASLPIVAKLLDRGYVTSAPNIRQDQVRAWLEFACRAAATLQAPELKPALEALAKSDDDARVRSAALEALKQY